MQETLPERLRSALDQTRPALKKSKLAKKLGVSPAAISHWLNGTRECPTATVREIAALTKVDEAWLLLGTGVQPRVAPTKTATRTKVNKDVRGLKRRYRRAPADGGKDYGNAGVYANPTSVRAIVREDGQNSLDAGLGGEVFLRFRVIELNPGSDRYKRFLDAMNFRQLDRHITACASETKIGNRLLAGLQHVREEKLVLLAIDDYATSGLLGDEFDSSSPYCALVRDNLNSRKTSTTAGGIFGVGAKVNLACSQLGTVFFASRLHGQESDGTRLIGRSELTYHETSRGGKRRQYAGPGWFGSKARVDVSSSVWLPDSHPLLDDLFLRRDHLPVGLSAKSKSGTSVLIVGFNDPQIDTSGGTKQIGENIVAAVAENFWPAIMKGQLSVSIERYADDSDTPVSVERVDPKTVAGIAPFCEAWEKFIGREEVPALTQPGDVVVTSVPLTVPATRGRDQQRAQHEELTSECKLIVRLAPPGHDRSDPRLNDLAYVRGRAMVTRYQDKGSAVVGGRPFHAMVLTGTMLGRTREQLAAEEFLRLSEPPAHDKWTFNSDVAEFYARGSKRLLDDFFDRIVEQLQRVLRPLGLSQDQGPEILDRLFVLHSLKPAAPRRPRVTVRNANGVIEGEAWVIDAEISIEPMAKPLLVTPTLAFEQEGGQFGVRWARLEITDGSGEVKPDGFVVPPRTKRVLFRGVSDPTSHPVPASSSAVFVDVAAKSAP